MRYSKKTFEGICSIFSFGHFIATVKNALIEILALSTLTELSEQRVLCSLVDGNFEYCRFVHWTVVLCLHSKTFFPNYLSVERNFEARLVLHAFFR